MVKKKITNLQLWEYAKTDYCVKPTLRQLIQRFIERKAMYECHIFWFKNDKSFIQAIIMSIWSKIEFKTRRRIK